MAKYLFFLAKVLTLILVFHFIENKLIEEVITKIYN